MSRSGDPTRADGESAADAARLSQALSELERALDALALETGADPAAMAAKAPAALGDALARLHQAAKPPSDEP